MNFKTGLLFGTAYRNGCRMKNLFLNISILLLAFTAHAQSARLNLTGDAKEENNLSYRVNLVNGPNQTGGAWYPQSFNLDSAFHIDFFVGFGDFKSEGFAIVLHSDSIPTGTGGEHLGVPSSGNSLEFEID